MRAVMATAREGDPTPFLSRSERKVALAVAEAAIPSRGALVGANDASVERLDRWLRAQPAPVSRAFVAALHTLDLATLPITGRRFHALDVARRTSLLVRLTEEGTQLSRSLSVAMITPIKAAHFDDAGVHAALDVPYGVTPPRTVEREGWRANALDGAELSDDDELECDVVVVGSGAGGGALAWELSRRGHAVLVIEAGRFFDRRDFDGRPLEMVRRMFVEHGLTMAIGNVTAPVWAGQTVGGSTTVNSGTCYRTPVRVLGEWQKDLGLRMLTTEALAPSFAAVEQILGVERAERAHLGTIAGVIARGADKLGLAHAPLHRNAPGCDGQGLCCFGCPTGAKRSVDVSFLPEALRRGAMLVSSARVERVLFDERTGRATGVLARARGGAKITVRARATVIAGGALLTPLLLKRSGVDNPWVGRNLSIHPAAKALAIMPERQEMWRGIPQGYAIEHFAEEGIMFEGASLPLTAAATSMTGVGPRFSEMLARYANLALFGFMIRDTSRGRIVARPDGGPAILYRMNGHDAKRMHRAMGTIVEVFLAAGAESVLPGVMGARPIHDAAELAAFRASRIHPSRFEASAYHPLGTARMSVDPSLGVVGPDHQVHGVEDLYVADGSVVPSSLGVNPQITIMALAVRAASILDGRL
jgi:hypothetical protein